MFNIIQDSFSRSTRNGAALLLLAALTLITFLIPPFDQPHDYHQWVDTRTVMGIPHFGDVLSNVGFFWVGLLGLWAIVQQRVCCILPGERLAWAVVFGGVFLTGFGSSYYHWAPDDARLMWDRLPMALGFMALISALIIERIGARIGLSLLPVLIVLGCASVVYWYWSTLHGAGDLRPYLLTQGGTLLFIPIILLLYPARYNRGHDYLIALGLYTLALLAEHLDEPIMALTGVISGHNLKHLIAAFAVYWLLRMLRSRTPLQNSSADVKDSSPH